MDVVFLLDNSVQGEAANFDLEINFAVDVLQSITTDNECVQFGAVLFGSPVQNPFFLNTYEQNVLATIDQIRNLVNSNTQKNLVDALTDMIDVQFTTENGDRPDAPNVAIIVTDGQAEGLGTSDSGRTAIEEANRAKTRAVDPIQILTVGINGNVNSAELEALSSNGQVYVATDFAQLPSLVQTVSDSVTQVLATTGNTNVVSPSISHPRLNSASFLS